MVGSGDLKGCNDVWGSRRIRGQLFQLKSRAKQTSVPARPIPTEVMQCSAAMLCDRKCMRCRADNEEARGVTQHKRGFGSFLLEVLRIDSFWRLAGRSPQRRESMDGVGWDVVWPLWTNQKMSYM